MICKCIRLVLNASLKARNTFSAILKRLPHNLTVLDELRPILIELGDLALCAELFSSAFAHYHAAFPTGLGMDPDNGQEVPGGGFGMMHILVLADLHNSLGQYDMAIEAIRKGCRWLQGRAQQKFWDVCEDDREYYVGVQSARGGDGELQPGMYPLDVNARHRLAVARIKMGDIEEGKVCDAVHTPACLTPSQKHADVILAQDVLEYAPLFTEIADAYFEREMYAEARHIYEALGGDAGVRMSCYTPSRCNPYNLYIRRPVASTYFCKPPPAAARWATSRRPPRSTSMVCCPSW